MSKDQSPVNAASATGLACVATESAPPQQDAKTSNQTKVIKELQDKVKDLSEEVSTLKEQADKPITVVYQAKEPRQVIFAQLHSIIHLPSLGQLPESMDTQPSSQQAKLRGLKMAATEHGLEVDLRGRTGFIPWGNVKWAVFKTLTKEEAVKADVNAGPNSVVPGYSGPTKVGTATVTAK